MDIKKLKNCNNLLQHQGVVIALILICLIIGYLTCEFNIIKDLTQDKRNVLTKESVNLLENINHPIEIIVFSSNTPNKGEYFRKTFGSLIRKYQQIKKDIYIKYIDPKDDPKLSRQYQIVGEGDVVISIQNRYEKMQLPYTEEAMTNILIKLQFAKEQKIRFIIGHNEPSIDSKLETGFYNLASVIRKNGWAAEKANLDNHHEHNSRSVLVLASPNKQLQDLELQALRDHILAGGNFIWLLGDPAFDINPLSDALGIALEKGIVIDPSMMSYGVPFTLTASSRYADTSGPTKGFIERTFFPNMRRVSLNSTYNNIWKTNYLIGVAENGWLSASTKAGDKILPNFDHMTDMKGPINVAVSLERVVNQKQQRILIIGGHEFINNKNIQQAGNKALIERMLEWSVNNYPSISMATKPLKDTVVVIPDDNWSRKVLLIIFNGFQFALPLILFAFAISTWRRKLF